MAILEVCGVSKSFMIPDARRDTVRDHVFALFQPRRFRELRVLDDVSFTLEAGETVGIMGPNGSGKSTLLKIIAGIYQPDRGQVVRRALMTPILELGVGWNPELDAIDNIHLIASVMGFTPAEIRAAIDHILAFAELAPFAHLKLQHYSTGMAARLAYAVAFHAVRDILILDEIFAVGDAAFRARCEARYRTLADRGHSVLLVSHDPAMIATFCDRAFLLDGGRIVAEGAPDRVGRAYLELMQSSRTATAVPAPIDHRALDIGASPVRAGERPPVNFGDLRRLEPFSTVWGLDRGTPVDRYYIDAFLREHRSDIRGRVLEVKDSGYTEQFGDGAVTQRAVVDIDATNSRATIVADLTRAENIASNQFDCFILTQTLHIIYDVRAALMNAHRILKADGVLLCTLPSVSRINYENGGLETGDYWRFTEASVRRLFAEIFPPGAVDISVRGNVLACAAFLYGLSAEEIEREELEHTDRWFPLLFCVRAVKSIAEATGPSAPANDARLESA